MGHRSAQDRVDHGDHLDRPLHGRTGQSRGDDRLPVMRVQLRASLSSLEWTVNAYTLAVAVLLLTGATLGERFGRRRMLMVDVPIGLALLPLARLRLGESRGTAQRLDAPGLVLASAGLFGVVFGLVRANGLGWGSGTVMGSLTAGAALLAAFVWWELRTRAPMLPMTLFRSRRFSSANVASFFLFFGMFGSVFLLAQFLQTAQHYSRLQAGLRILPWTAMPIVGAPIAGVLSDRVGGRLVVLTGLALQCIGLAWGGAGPSRDRRLRQPRTGLRGLRHRHVPLLRARRQHGALGGATGPGSHRLGYDERHPRARWGLRDRRPLGGVLIARRLPRPVDVCRRRAACGGGGRGGRGAGRGGDGVRAS